MISDEKLQVLELTRNQHEQYVRLNLLENKPFLDYVNRFYVDQRKRNVDTLQRFCIGSSYISDKIYKNAKLYVDPKISTAAASSDGGVTIGAILFTEENHENYFIPDSYKMAFIIACFNGFLIHEKQHLNKSFPYFKNWIDNLKDGYNKNLFHSCANIIEDIYIDDYTRRKFQYEYLWLKTMRNIFANQYVLDFVENSLKEPNLQVVVNCLGSYCSIEKWEDKAFDSIREITDICEKAIRMESSSDREALSYELYDKLVENADEEEIEGFTQQNTSMSIVTDENGNVQKIEMDGEEIDIASLPQNVQNELQKISDQLSKDAQDYNNNKQYNYQNYYNPPTVGKKENKVLFMDILEEEAHQRNPYKPQIVNEFTDVSRFLKYAMVHVPDIEPPKSTGRKLIKSALHRIVIDRRVLRPKSLYVREDRGNPEVILLIDISGSTEQHAKGGKRVIQYEIDAAYSFYWSLMNADIPASVYAFTVHGDKCVLYGVSAYKMSLFNDNIITTRNFKERFEKLDSVYHGGNFDGGAIQIVSKRFTKRKSDKVLIVLSDGMPTESLHKDVSPDQELRDAVKSCYDNGINLLAVSVLQSVYKNLADFYDKFSKKTILADINEGDLGHSMAQIGRSLAENHKK